MYKEIWEAAVGEELVCAREPHNSHDRYTTSLLARAIACEGRYRENGPLGAGRPFWGFK